MQVASKTSRTSTRPRLSLLVFLPALLLLFLSLLAINAVSATAQAKPRKAPAPSVSPQPLVGGKACPAYARYNPKTRSCEKIRF
jgi:hypothetical protein